MTRKPWPFLLALMLVACAPTFAEGGIPNVDVRSREFIRTWLVCGPFANALAPGVSEYRHDETTLGYYIDWLAPIDGEEEVRPEEGLAFTGPDGANYAWRRWTSPGDELDFTKVYERHEKVVAYAACRLVSEIDRDVVLCLGSNDGVKAWLNGVCVLDNHCPRLAVPDQDRVVAPLERGANLLLVKVDQGLGAWGLYARLFSPEEIVADIEAGRIAPALPFECEAAHGRVTACLGRGSVYRLLDPIPRYSVTLTTEAGETVATGSAVIGDLVAFGLGDLDERQYWIVCRAELPGGIVFEYRQPYAPSEHA